MNTITIIKRRLAGAAVAVAAAVAISACGQSPDQIAAVEVIPAEALSPVIGFNPAVNGPGSTTLHIPEIESPGPFVGQDGPGGTSMSMPVDDVARFDAQRGPGSNSL